MNVVSLTLVTMCAFAANSFLCRAALGAQQIDSLSFTAVRLISGALPLWLCLRWQSGARSNGGNWKMALALLAYALFFSLAYVQLSTGTGALILFGFVQGTMIIWAATRGDRLRGRRALGAAVAASGLVVLLWPSLKAPESMLAAVSMAIAGIAWGFYSIWGKGSSSPLADTAGNFARASLVIFALWLAAYGLIAQGVHIPGVSVSQGLAFPKVYMPEPSVGGVLLALASGCLASGLGYALWYKVLPQLPTTSAASVQLSVPVIAAFAGLAMLNEPFGLRLILAMGMTLGGIAVVVLSKQK